MGRRRMKEYKILLHPLLVKDDIPKLDKEVRSRIKRSIEERLKFHPNKFGKPLRGTLKDLWSVRVGDYRVIYRISGNQVWILNIGHRREVYKKTIREVQDHDHENG